MHRKFAPLLLAVLALALTACEFVTQTVVEVQPDGETAHVGFALLADDTGLAMMYSGYLEDEGDPRYEALGDLVNEAVMGEGTIDADTLAAAGFSLEELHSFGDNVLDAALNSAESDAGEADIEALQEMLADGSAEFVPAREGNARGQTLMLRDLPLDETFEALQELGLEDEDVPAPTGLTAERDGDLLTITIARDGDAQNDPMAAMMPIRSELVIVAPGEVVESNADRTDGDRLIWNMLSSGDARAVIDLGAAAEQDTTSDTDAQDGNEDGAEEGGTASPVTFDASGEDSGSKLPWLLALVALVVAGGIVLVLRRQPAYQPAAQQHAPGQGYPQANQGYPAAQPGQPQGPGATPQGWYPDPSGQAGFRWWDGQNWTQHTQ